MGLFEELFGDRMAPTRDTVRETAREVVRKGSVTTLKVDITEENYADICKDFIAFDTETTGFRYDNDRIVELGAVMFQDGEIADQFGTLVNPGRTIPAQATAVNHITNAMLKEAPLEVEVYADFCQFFEKVLSGEVVVCAHNASFDMNFLSRTLERLGYSGTIRYVDTLSLSRKLVKGLPNYKQPTLADHFGYVNTAEHRAVSDAEVCGRIFYELLKIKRAEI